MDGDGPRRLLGGLHFQFDLRHGLHDDSAKERRQHN